MSAMDRSNQYAQDPSFMNSQPNPGNVKGFRPVQAGEDEPDMSGFSGMSEW